MPFNVLALLFAGVVALLLVRLRRQPPLSSAGDEVGGLSTLAVPGTLPPAMAGALIQWRVADAQIEATVLDFVRRRLLVLTPDGPKKACLRLEARGRESALSGYERDRGGAVARCRTSVVARDYQPNLDTDLPYIVALGLLGKLAPRVKAASEQGYAPSWFRASDGQEHNGYTMPIAGFFPYWIAFHASAAPVSSGSASGGFRRWGGWRRRWIGRGLLAGSDRFTETQHLAGGWRRP